MDIFNRIPSISEDTLVYSLYPSADSADKAVVIALAAQIEAYVQSLLPNHIWHRDQLELKATRDKLSPKNKAASRKTRSGDEETNTDCWMLEGYMRVGDSVDDEWLAVWILNEVSKRWDVAISVYDSDGDFLLIEAAEHLPTWVTPENSENRVWLYQGNMHLIPLAYLSAPSSGASKRRKLSKSGSDEDDGLADDVEGWLNVPDALEALKSNGITEAPEDVQNAVTRRISGYPDAAALHVHVTKAFLPVDIIKALIGEPSLVQRAVETFYTRDAMQLRAAHKMSRFPPQTSQLANVKMTRTAYAQLVGQKFHPPKIFGHFSESEGTEMWRWKDIGMKIACGFEMLYQESKSKVEGITSGVQQASADARKDALRRNTEYVEYIRILKSTGYFRGELEDSTLWNNLENKAMETFIGARRDGDTERKTFAALANDAIARAGDTTMLPDLPEDSDSWLNIPSDGLDQKLAETFNPALGDTNVRKKSEREPMDVDDSKREEEDRISRAQADKLKGLASKIEQFVEGEGTLEGAVFEDEEFSEDEVLSEFSVEGTESDVEDTKQDTAKDSVANTTRQAAMDKLVPCLDPSEYGKMPASFYANSQKVAAVTMETEVRDTKHAAASGQILDDASCSSRPIRRPILPRDAFDGVDSDDETDEGGDDGDNESEEDQPQVVGEVEIDMGAEQEEFLEFSRSALGISDEMWNGILRDRRQRGAFVPENVKSGPDIKKEGRTDGKQAASPQDEQRLRSPQSGPRPNANPNLDSFEAVMEAMEAELAKSRSTRDDKGKTRSNPTTSTNARITRNTPSITKGNGKMEPLQEASDGSEDEDVEAAMETELRAALERDEGDSGDEEPMDYGMIRNFLESFKSQAGLAGPVSTLAGRLEPNWKLPRDES